MQSNAVLLQKTLQITLHLIQVKIAVYHTSSGFGVRLDGGNGFAGAARYTLLRQLVGKSNCPWQEHLKDTI